MRTLDLETDKMLAHVDEGVGWITFNQPEKRNAVSYAMWQAIPQIIEDFNSSSIILESNSRSDVLTTFLSLGCPFIFSIRLLSVLTLSR